MKALLFLFLSIFLVNNLLGQNLAVDSRGKDVFEFYKGAALSGNFIPNQISMQANYNIIIRKPVAFSLDSDPSKLTVTKSHAISLLAKINGVGENEGKPFSLKKELLRPSYKFEIGYQRSIDKFNNIRDVPSPFAFSAGASIYYEKINLNLYDTTVREFQSKKNGFIGIHAHSTLFHKSGRFAISLSGDFGSGYNSDKLKAVISSSAEIFDGITALSNETGYFGSFEEVGKFRSRVSIPIFIIKEFMIVPFFTKYGFTNYRSKTLTGFNFNFFSGKPRIIDSKLGQGFGFGIDWVESKNVWSSPNYYLYGSLDLETLRKTVITKPKGKKQLLY